MLVTALADKPLAVACVSRRAHRVDRHAAFVERLEEQFAIGRHGEVCAAVRFDRHGAEHPAAGHDRVARLGDPLAGFVRTQAAAGHSAGQQLQDAERFDLRALRPTLLVVIDIDDRHGRFAFVANADRLAVPDLRQRRGGRGGQRLSSQRDRVHAADVGIAIEQLLVAEGVHQVNAVVLARAFQRARRSWRRHRHTGDSSRSSGQGVL